MAPKKPKRSVVKSSNGSTSLFGGGVSDKYAKELAFALGVDARDKEAIQTVKKNLDKVVDNVLETSSDYEGVLRELTSALKDYKSKGEKFQPKRMAELEDLEDDLKEITSTMRKLAANQKVPEASMAALSPLMLKVANSMGALRSGEWGKLAIKDVLEEKGLGGKVDAQAIAALYKKNTELIGRDYKKFMQEHSSLMKKTGATAGLTKTALTALLGPIAQPLNEMFELDKKAEKKFESFWKSLKGIDDKSLDEQVKQRKLVEEQVEIAQAEMSSKESDANSARAWMNLSKEEQEEQTKIAEKTKSLIDDLKGDSTVQTGLLGSIVGILEVIAAKPTGGPGLPVPGVDIDLPDGPGGKGKGPKPKPKGGFWSKVGKGAKALGRGAMAVGSTVLSAPVLAGAAAVTGVAAAGQAIHSVATGGSGKNFISEAAGDTVMGTARQAISNVASGTSNLMSGTKNFFSDVTGKTTVGDVLKEASSKTGVPYDLLATFASIESGFNPNAQAKTSSAGGLFQFIDSTWNTMVGKYGAKFGIGKGDKMDPRANATMGAMFIKENSDILSKAGLPVDATSLYMAHFLGPGGAVKFMKGMLSNPDGSAVDAAGEAAANANKSIFYDGGRARSSREVYAIMEGKTSKHANAGQKAMSVAVSGGAATGGGKAPAGGGGGGSIGAAAGAVASAAPAASVSRAAPTGGASAGATSSAPTLAGTSSTKDSAPNINIDTIPMYVDDSGLVLVTMGGLG